MHENRHNRTKLLEIVTPVFIFTISALSLGCSTYLLTIIIITTTQGVCHCVTQFVGGAIKIGSGLVLHQHLVNVGRRVSTPDMLRHLVLTFGCNSDVTWLLFIHLTCKTPGSSSVVTC